MAWNPSKEVAAARGIGEQFGFDQVVIIGIDNKDGRMAAISYGETQKLCGASKALADIAYNAIFDYLSK